MLCHIPQVPLTLHSPLSPLPSCPCYVLSCWQQNWHRDLLGSSTEGLKWPNVQNLYIQNKVFWTQSFQLLIACSSPTNSGCVIYFSFNMQFPVRHFQCAPLWSPLICSSRWDISNVPHYEVNWPTLPLHSVLLCWVREAHTATAFCTVVLGEWGPHCHCILYCCAGWVRPPPPLQCVPWCCDAPLPMHSVLWWVEWCWLSEALKVLFICHYWCGEGVLVPPRPHVRVRRPGRN